MSGALLLGGCDKIAESYKVRRVLGSAESLTQWVQRLFIGRTALATEYTEAQISPSFRVNGNDGVDDDAYQAFADKGFEGWRLEVAGLVERPQSLSLDELRALPSRTQITRHDCVEGWSCIGKWKGVRLGALVERVGLKPEARYLVFRCADSFGPDPYYESIDLVDAMHEQTILAYEINDKPLPIPYGAPIRLRVERQLGYKQAKFIMRIEAVASFADIAGGRGGYWEDQGYEWYAGI
jgi:DMSO/TMAO reductase YedYZ molybdopterin-dependent catalytic subunit